MSKELTKCDCDCCTKCILCRGAPRTRDDPWCKECREDMNTRFDKLEANKNE